MFIIAILALSAVKGTFGVSRCSHVEPFEICRLSIDKVLLPTTKERLTKFCPIMKEFYKCFNEKNKKHSLETSCDTDFNYVISAEELVLELCDHNSRFHRNFFSSLPCYFGLEDQLYACNKKTADVYARFRTLLQQEDFLKETSEDLDKCLNTMNTMMCLHDKIDDACGIDALRLYVEIMERTGYFLMYCNEKNMKTAEQITSIVSKVMEVEKPTHFTIKDMFNLMEVPAPCPSVF